MISEIRSLRCHLTKRQPQPDDQQRDMEDDLSTAPDSPLI